MRAVSQLHPNIWPATKAALLEVMWRKGMSSWEIAKHLGVSTFAVRHKVCQLRKQGRDLPWRRGVSTYDRTPRRYKQAEDNATRDKRRCLGPSHGGEAFYFVSAHNGERTCRNCRIMIAGMAGSLA